MNLRNPQLSRNLSSHYHLRFASKNRVQSSLQGAGKMVAAAAAANKTSYEECRRLRLEENKKRMEALNLPKLAQSLRKLPRTPTPSPMKVIRQQSSGKQTIVVRRSGRVANLPAPVYREILFDKVNLPRRIFRRRDPSNITLASAEAREFALQKAEELQNTLESEYPSFVKSMLPSHVSGGFWLGLPVHFCKTSLPKNDGGITLVNEEAEEFPVIYLARKSGLSGGWKGFAVAHELTDGDALIFQLISSTKMKVHIIRVASYDEDEGKS